MLCNAPLAAPEAHEIPDGARAIAVNVHVDWGDSDIRPEWDGLYSFCSFGCLEEWATEQAVKHDGRVVVEGAKPEGDES